MSPPAAGLRGCLRDGQPGRRRGARGPGGERRRKAAQRVGRDARDQADAIGRRGRAGDRRRRQIRGIERQRGGHAEGAGEEQILLRQDAGGAPEGFRDAVFQGGEGRVREGMAGDGEEETG